jgi:hypothetical protein
MLRCRTRGDAILHSRFWIDGEVLHDDLSQASRESVGTRVLRKIDGRWRVIATQNTDVRPGTPCVHGCRTGAQRQRRANLTRKSASPPPR